MVTHPPTQRTGPEQGLDLTLAIPCFRGEQWIATCLSSVAAQTLSREKFEVLLVINGDPDRSAELARAQLSRETGLQYRILELQTASASNARNVAVREARGRWLTWLDVDDWISPEYLEQMHKVAEPGVVPLASIIDVYAEDGSISPSPIAAQTMEFPAGIHDSHRLWRPLTFNACKLIEQSVLATRDYDVTLRSGEDVAYFGPLFAERGLRFDNTPAHSGATYFRLVRSGSLSRQEPDFDFAVEQRLAVIRHLDDAVSSSDGPLVAVMRSMIRSQALFIHRYFNAHPDSLIEIRRAVAASRIRDFPWHVVNGQTNRLAISYNFAPYIDASAVVAAKRLLQDEHQWNVICGDLSSVRQTDPQLHMRVLSAVSRQSTVRTPAYFAQWSTVHDFCRSGLEHIRNLELEHGPQNCVYSRALWPASHFLAALHKIEASYEVYWTAEFSDPLLRDIHGNDRAGTVDADDFAETFERAMGRHGFRPPIRSLFAWAEYLPYLFADSLVFTNPHQLHYMLSYLADERLRDLVRSKSLILEQPGPPSEWYSVAASPIPDRREVNIGYFGTFYATRGLSDLLSGIEGLPAKDLERLRLDVYGKVDMDTERRHRHLLRSGVLRVLPPLPYLEFLNRCTHYECLLVNDAETASQGKQVNPYLPSKLSDYRGARTRIWGIVEPGSMLSRSNLTYRTRIGDAHDARRVVTQLLMGGSHA